MKTTLIPSMISNYICPAKGISAGRKTIAADLVQLQEAGYNVVRNDGHPNQYFIIASELELPELKLLVDAVQAARFISRSKSERLIRKLTSLANPYQAKELKR